MPALTRSRRSSRSSGWNGLAGLADTIRTLGPTYQAHGEQIQAAAWAREDNTITWHLIHTLEKLERGVD